MCPKYASVLKLLAVITESQVITSILAHLAHALLHFKGFQCLQAHRVAHVLWHRGRKRIAVAFQSRCSEVFGMDLHPAATIGRGVMFDHGTGIVVGETARIGDECSLLHGVTRMIAESTAVCPSRFHSIKSSVEHAPTPPFNQSGAASPSFSGPWGASCSPYQRCVGVGRPPSLPYHAV